MLIYWKNTEMVEKAETEEELKMLEKEIEEIFEKYGTDPRPIFERPHWSIEAFHPTNVQMVERDDDWFCDMRANHFVVITGWGEDGYDQYSIMVIANHKGELKYRTATYYDMREYTEGLAWGMR